MTWDTTTPPGSEARSQGDDRIRELKVDIQGSLRGQAATGIEAIFPGSDTANPVFRYRGLKGATGARPASGQYGLFFDTSRNALQRDNGATWDDVATMIPAGTAMVFYQASAPTGWTAVAVNDKFLRVVTAGGTGGTTGGSVAASTSLAHTHTVASHTHDLANHTHSVPQGRLSVSSTPTTLSASSLSVGNASPGAGLNAYSGGGFVTANIVTDTIPAGTSGTPSPNTSGATSPSTDSQLGVFAYADIIIATKN